MTTLISTNNCNLGYVIYILWIMFYNFFFYTFLFFLNFIHFFIVVAHISLFVALYIAFCLFVYYDMCCAIWSYGHKTE